MSEGAGLAGNGFEALAAIPPALAHAKIKLLEKTPNEPGILLKTKGRNRWKLERTRNVVETNRHTLYRWNVVENKHVILRFKPQKSTC